MRGSEKGKRVKATNYKRGYRLPGQGAQSQYQTHLHPTYENQIFIETMIQRKITIKE